MVDKNYCMSSYLALRYIEDSSKEFAEGMQHRNLRLAAPKDRVPVSTAIDIDNALKSQFQELRGKKLGLLLSGGMDSGSLAAYMEGCDAYTFRFLGGGFQEEERKRAERFADAYGMALHYVDISWKTVETYVDAVMCAKAAPVHSIEPQILQAALQAKGDGVEIMVIGESSDLIFGGMDQLIAKEWGFDEFMDRYMFTKPQEVLASPVSMEYLFARYRKEGGGIDYLRFMDEVFAVESSGSYWNAFRVAGMAYFDPYAALVMADGIDLNRVRDGEPKYLIRELFAMKHPDMPIPFKNPMPRPVDIYFENWGGPKRPEFCKDIDIGKYTGNQKWQMWCLERFLDTFCGARGKTAQMGKL